MTERIPDPLPRCCHAHVDWPTLTEHLLGDFAAVDASTVMRELNQAREATRALSLTDPDALLIAELVARNQLLMMTGRQPDTARLDPERHQRSEQAPTPQVASA